MKSDHFELKYVQYVKAHLYLQYKQGNELQKIGNIYSITWSSFTLYEIQTGAFEDNVILEVRNHLYILSLRCAPSFHILE